MQVKAALEALGAEPHGLDLKALVGRRPWLRLRAGDYRILLGPTAATKGERSILVARVVNRRQLEKAVRSL